MRVSLSKPPWLPAALVVLSVSCLATPVQAAEPISFANDVMPVLSKAGCNAGTCHGNANGKGGFRLSLRGQDPAADYRALLREHEGRRVDLIDPANSLILCKPTMQLAHEGGKRFDRQSPHYQILLRWLHAGAPPPQADSPKLVELNVSPREQVIFEPKTSVQLSATTVFSDGTRRDIRTMAVYEASNLIANITADGLVERQSPGETTIMVRFLEQQVPVSLAFVPARPHWQWSNPPANNYVDTHVFAKLKSLRMNPSRLCSDHVFVRRAYLDLLGILPTAGEARAFVADTSNEKRDRLIDRLLARPEFAQVWALRWSDVLRNEEKTLDRQGVAFFHEWMQASFAQGKPLNQFVHELVSARGSTYKNPPANYWRAMRDPVTRAETTARLFLGVRLQCAKCHNHPFDRWTQDDYYSWAALFARIDYKLIDKNKPKDKLDKHEFVGEQIVLIADKGEMRNPDSGHDAKPKFLGAPPPELSAKEDRLLPLADWISARENRQFARAQVNRIWYYVMGRGVVEPIDDFRATNPPVNGPLLEALAGDFIASGFDVRHIIRRIMTSRTYGLSSRPNETNIADEANFSRAIVRRLTAEQLIDAQSQVLGVSPAFNGYPPGTRAGQIAGVRRVRRRDETPAGGDHMLRLFGKPDRLLGCECERTNNATLRQALTLVSGEELNGWLSHADNRLARWVGSDAENQEIIDQLYWSSLGRPPSQQELAAAENILAGQEGRLAALQDIAWALLNSTEFLLRQ